MGCEFSESKLLCTIDIIHYTMPLAPDLLPRIHVALYDLLSQIPDPEVPVLSVLELGVVRKAMVIPKPDGSPGVRITITPTYTGCPAMDMISMQIRMACMQAGYAPVDIETVLHPAWTTDWLSPEARAKLEKYGIAPPMGNAGQLEMLETLAPPCPHCKSTHTRLLNRFGSTACKALFQCADCLEPFDYFKCH